MRIFEKRGCVRGRILGLLTRLDDHATRRDLLFASLATLHERGADRVECYSADGCAMAALTEAGLVPRKVPVPTSAVGLAVPAFYCMIGDGDAD